MNAFPIVPVAFFALFAPFASAQSFDGTVDSDASSGVLTTVAGLTTSGSLIGDYNPDTNPDGTQTRPGLFGGSGNNAIPVSTDLGAETDVSTNPAGGVSIETDFDALTIRFDGFMIDLLNGASGATELSVTMTFSTFHTVNPSFIYPGGIPITLPLGDAASITRAELVQVLAADGVLTPTADPDIFDFSAVIPGEANLTLAVGLPGSDPVPNDVDALPVVLPISGRVTRLLDGTIMVTVVGDAQAAQTGVPLDIGALPEIPFELPTLGTATAGVLLTLTPEELTFEASMAVDLTIAGVAGVCDADWNADGLVNFFDIVGFIGSYNAQEVRADLAAPFGSWNFFDVAAYLGMYNAGCP